MNISRSDIRHSCYRIKNNQPYKPELIALVEPKLTNGEKWVDFADKWDILLNRNNEIVIIKPEVNYDYVHTVCLEASLYKKKGFDWDFDDRAGNVLQVVELNMMDNMLWEEYNQTWGVYIDPEVKKIHTKLFKTVQNIVTPEMIESSKQSDGAVMIEQGFVPTVDMKMEPFEPTDAERALINAALGRK